MARDGAEQEAGVEFEEAKRGGGSVVKLYVFCADCSFTLTPAP